MTRKKKKYNEIEPFHAWVVILFASILALVLMMNAYNGFRKEIKNTIDSAQGGFYQKKGGLAWIEIDFGNGRKRLFEGEVNAQSYTLGIALYAASQAGSFDFAIEKGAITSLAGSPNTRANQWAIYRNGDSVREQNLENITIASGDIYTFRYE